jgi:hypothetical protein
VEKLDWIGKGIDMGVAGWYINKNIHDEKMDFIVGYPGS